MLSSIVFWGSSKPSRSISYTDSLFLVVSAMTLAGLNTINLSQINTFQQFILFLLIMLGSAIFVSIGVVHVRKNAFERRFESIVEEARQRRKSRNNSRRTRSFSKPVSHSRPEVDGVVVRGRAIKSEKPSVENLNGGLGSHVEPTPAHNQSPLGVNDSAEKDLSTEDLETRNSRSKLTKASSGLAIDTEMTRRITFASPTSPTRAREHGRILSMQGVGARQNIQNHPIETGPPFYPTNSQKLNEQEPGDDPGARHGILLGGLIGRNSQFSSLTLTEREHLGGVEYRAISMLAVIVPLYFVLWQLIGCIGLGAYVARNRASTSQINAENPWYYILCSLCHLNLQRTNIVTGGLAPSTGSQRLTTAECLCSTPIWYEAWRPDPRISLIFAKVAFQTADYMLITMGLMILAGNTCYPVFLRLIIWTMFKLIPDWERFQEYKVTLRFLLDHPRRCYTNLFPSRHTWWLLVTLIALNGTDWVAFEVLNVSNTHLTFHAYKLSTGLDWKYNRHIASQWCPCPRWSLPSPSSPQRRFLRCFRVGPSHWPPDPLRSNDVYLGLSCRNHHTQFQRLRRAELRHLRQ